MRICWIALAGADIAQAQCGTIRLRLLKILTPNQSQRQAILRFDEAVYTPTAILCG